jgi:hypothetical protein
MLPMNAASDMQRRKDSGALPEQPTLKLDLRVEPKLVIT